MKVFVTRYRLRNGASGVLRVIAASSCAAIVHAMDLFGDALRCCAARPASSPHRSLQ